MARPLLFLFALFSLLSIAYATPSFFPIVFNPPDTYYLNQNGGSDSNSGTSSSSAWLTLKGACQGAVGKSNGTLIIFPGVYTLSPSDVSACNMPWNITSSTLNLNDVTLILSQTIKVSTYNANVTSLNIIGKVAPGNAALNLYYGGGITGCNFTISSGAAVDFGPIAPGGYVNPGSVVWNVNVSYFVADPDPVYPGVFSSWAGPAVSGLGLYYVNFFGTYFGGGSAVYASTQLLLWYTTVQNHNGTDAAVSAGVSGIEISYSQFINNTGVRVGAINAQCQTPDLGGPGLPEYYLDKVRVSPSLGGVAVPQPPNGKHHAAPPIYKNDIFYALDNYVQNSLFENNVASEGAGGLVWCGFGADLAVTDTTFLNNSGLYVGGLWLYHGANVTLSKLNFFENTADYFSALVVDGGGRSSTYIDGMTVAYNLVTFSAAAEDPLGFATSSVLLNKTTVIMSSSIFELNASPYCPHLIMHEPTGPVTTIYESWFLNSISYDSAPVCIFGEDGTYGPADIFLFANVFNDTTFVSPSIDPWIVASQLNIFEANVTIQDYVNAGSDYWAAIAIGDYTNLTVLTDYGSSTATLPGFLLFGSNLELAASVTNVNGRAGFLNLNGSLQHSLISATSGTATINFNTLNSQQKSTYTVEGALTWVQDGTFQSVSPNFYNPTVVCCTSGSVPAVLNFIGGSPTFYAPYSWWLNNLNPVFSSSLIEIRPGAILDAVYPIKDALTENRITINGPIQVDGTLRISDAFVNSYFTLSSSGTLILYPSQWGSMDHRLVLGGTFYLSGAIVLDERFASVPFQPVISYDPPQQYVLIEAPSVLNSSSTGVTSYYMQYMTSTGTNPNLTPVRQPGGAYSPFYVTATTVRLVPYSVIDDTVSAINMNFIIPPPYPFSCEELAATMSLSGQFDVSSLSCQWTSSTSVKVASTTLPLIGDIVSLDNPNNFYVGTPYYGVMAPNNPVLPNAIVRHLPELIPCGDQAVAFDGTLTTGLGSYPYYWGWFLVNTTDTNTTITNALSYFLGTQSFYGFTPFNSDIARRGLYFTLDPYEYFTPGETYTFELVIASYGGLYLSAPNSFSPQFSLSLPLTADPTPKIVMDGPPVRTAFIGADISLQARVFQDSCGQSTALKFVWRDFPGVDSPSIVILGSNFTTPGNKTYSLTAYHVDTPLASVQLDFTVVVVPPQFALASASPTHFFYGSNVSLSIDIQGYNTRIPLSTSGVSYNWILLSCPTIDGRQARPGVQPPTIGSYQLGAGPDITVPTYIPTCLHPSGQAYAITLFGQHSSSVVIPSTVGLDIGNYTLQCQVTLFTVVKTMNFTIEVMAGVSSIPPQIHILLPSSDTVLQPSSRLVFTAYADGNPGFGVLQQEYAIAWQIINGVSSTTAPLNTSVLSLQYSDLIPGQLVVLTLTATSYKTGLTSTTNATFAPNVAPFGGQLYVLPTSGSVDTNFTFRSLPWSSMHQPLKYQYSLAPTADPASKYFVTPVSETSVYIGTLPAVRRILSASGALNASITVQLTVIDSLGTTALSQTEIFVEIDPSPLWTLDVDLLALASRLHSAANATDWNSGAALIVSIVDALIDRMKLEALGPASLPLGVVLATAQQTDALVIEILVTSSVTLAQTLPITTSTTAAVLNHFELILQLIDYTNFTTAEASLMASLINNLVYVESNSYDDASDHALAALTSNIRLAGLVGQILYNANSTTLNLLSVDAAIASLSSAMSQKPPTDPALTIPVTGALAVVQMLSINTSEPVVISHSDYPTSVSIDPSQFDSSSVPNGVVGYHHIQFVGSYPNPSVDAATSVVSITTIDTNPSAIFSKKNMLVTTHFITNFTEVNTTTSAVTCATYDSSSQTWVTSSCTTSIEGSTVTCDCSGSSGSPLSVLFASSPSAPPSVLNNNYGGLTLGGVIGVAVGGAAALIIITIIIVLLTVPKFRRVIQPYYGTHQKE